MCGRAAVGTGKSGHRAFSYALRPALQQSTAQLTATDINIALRCCSNTSGCGRCPPTWEVERCRYDAWLTPTVSCCRQQAMRHLFSQAKGHLRTTSWQIYWLKASSWTQQHHPGAAGPPQPARWALSSRPRQKKFELQAPFNCTAATFRQIPRTRAWPPCPRPPPRLRRSAAPQRAPRSPFGRPSFGPFSPPSAASPAPRRP